MKNANPVSLGRLGLVLLALATGWAGCGQKPAAVAKAPKTVAAYFTIKVGPWPVRMQLAVLSAEMQRGLMERRNLGANEGMLFVYGGPQRMSFWMHDTPTPLDIGFFDPDGVLKEIYPMQPYDETPVRSRGDDLQFALEMHQGWYAAHDVRPGARFDMTALKAAMRERGFDPRKLRPSGRG